MQTVDDQNVDTCVTNIPKRLSLWFHVKQRDRWFTISLWQVWGDLVFEVPDIGTPGGGLVRTTFPVLSFGARGFQPLIGNSIDY